MKFSEWKPFYTEILADFGYSREADWESAQALNRYLEPFNIKRLHEIFDGQQVVIAGDAPSLLDEWNEKHQNRVIVAADAACQRLQEHGVVPDVVCTDLDGAPEIAAQLTNKESIAVVHAHGDNEELVQEWMGDSEFDIENVVGTTQTEPFGKLHNFGGFTDGDRAAILADEFNASKIKLVGFDFTDSSVGSEKARKLEWARRLIEHLEEKRGEKLY